MSVSRNRARVATKQAPKPEDMTALLQGVVALQASLPAILALVPTLEAARKDMAALAADNRELRYLLERQQAVLLRLICAPDFLLHGGEERTRILAVVARYEAEYDGKHRKTAPSGGDSAS